MAAKADTGVRKSSCRERMMIRKFDERERKGCGGEEEPWQKQSNKSNESIITHIANDAGTPKEERKNM